MEEKIIITLRCGGCRKIFKAYRPEEPGTYPVTCPHCQHQNYIKIPAPASTQPATEPKSTEPARTVVIDLVRKPTIGKLVWRKFLIPHKYILHDGTNTIGRADEEEPTDLPVKDRFISRNSAVIEVISTMEKGTIYKFLLQRTKNPVLVNGRQMKIGESLYLRFGDVIKMGNTVFTFKEVKK